MSIRPFAHSRQDSEAYTREITNWHCPKKHETSIPLSTWKTYVVATAVMLAGIVLIGTGSQMFQGWVTVSNPVTMRVVGVAMVILGFYGLVKKSLLLDKIEVEEEPPIVDTGDLIYGSKAWKEYLGVEVEEVAIPKFDWNREDPFFHKPYRENYVLLYVPEKVQTQGETELPP